MKLSNFVGMFLCTWRLCQLSYRNFGINNPDEYRYLFRKVDPGTILKASNAELNFIFIALPKENVYIYKWKATSPD